MAISLLGVMSASFMSAVQQRAAALSSTTIRMAAGESAASIRAGMLAAGGAPVAKTVPSSQTVEVAGVSHTLNDEYQWMRGKAWPKLVQDEDIIAHLEAENVSE